MRLNSNIVKVIILIQLFLFLGCRTSKIPEGDYLLLGSDYKYIDDKKKPYKDELSDNVLHKPNSTILMFFPYHLWVYGLSNKEYDNIYKDYYSYSQSSRSQRLLDSLYIAGNKAEKMGKPRWLDRTLYRNGQAPVLVDTAEISKSKQSLENFFKNKGWREASVESEIVPKGKKKAIVKYNITLGKPTVVSSLSYDIPSEDMENMYKLYLNYTDIKIGMRLDANEFQKEINALEYLMNNTGYYGFNSLKDEVYYEVDTTESKYEVPVKLKIVKSPYSGARRRNREEKPDSVFRKYEYKDINIYLGDDSEDLLKIRTAVEEGRLTDLDSIKSVEDDYNIYNNSEKRPSGRRREYKNRILRNLLVMHPGDIYKSNSEEKTKSYFNRLGNFNVAEFNTTAFSDSLLTTSIFLYPVPKYSYQLSLEAFKSKLVSYAISPSLTFSVKNLFGNAENLDITFSGTAGNVQSYRDKDKYLNSSELGVATTLNFPQWVFPLSIIKSASKRLVPTSSFTAGYSVQNNIGLDRQNYFSGLNYYLNPKNTITHKISLWNLQYTAFKHPERYFDLYTADRNVRNDVYGKYFDANPEVKDKWESGQLTDKDMAGIIQSDAEFVNGLGEELSSKYNLVESRRKRFTEDVLISSIGYNFTYDERLDKSVFNPFYFSGSFESAGVLPSLLKQKGVGDEGRMLGVPYAQFFKLDFDIRKYWKLSAKKTLATRMFVGLGIPYGNSKIMPFDRNYSIGGANDLRAWRAFGLGPGASNLGAQEGFELVALENVKLLTSIEYRTPLTKHFEGALFMDAGNIWSTRKGENQFKINEFYKELGIGGGMGLRYNISYFTLRFDFAYKFHDPTKEEGKRWVIDKIKPLKPQVQFAIGYPF